MSDTSENLNDDVDLDRMDNADGAEPGPPAAVPLFRVDMSLMPDGQIVGMHLHWNGGAVRNVEFAAAVLNEVKRQLDDVGVAHSLVMSAVMAAAEFDRMTQEASDAAQ